MIQALHVILASATLVTGLTANKPDNVNRYTFAAPYQQSFQEGYSILKHVGGIGPYSNRASSGVGRDPPDGCAVDQVIMIRRHGERYPQGGDQAGIEKALHSLYGSNITQWRGDLAFLNSWKYYVSDNGRYGLETDSGPYNGLLTSYKHGAEYRTRYGHLWNDTSDDVTPMWAGDFERVVQTARKFGEGFFGWNYTNSVALNLIPETPDMGANSLTPSCPNDPGDNPVCLKVTRLPIFQVAADRLNAQNPGLNLTLFNVYVLMYMSVFELNVNGYSEWINAFTLDEWLAFGYTQDLQFYYCAGPGNKYANAVGAVYLNASLALLNAGPENTRPIFFNFAHDTNITPILAALGIGNPDKDLPLDRIPFPNTYNTGDLMPMGGHLTIERLSCNTTSISPKDTYVRIVVNEAVVPFTSCQEGPGFSCSLANYTSMLNKSLPNFVSTCGLNDTVPHDLSFWWNYNTTTNHTVQTDRYIPYQGQYSV